ncbi:aminotransferase class I/II-fold pyridoxal phosphate-dependent enzyme, partial [Azotobacter chroococcum]|nr:aminotransferase class I/II-fold pyridoxal phosphate-dependent enzyme [Azotobacter chroococcum]
QSNWYPDIADIKAKITRNTRALLLINPNNPTGAVYPKEVLEDIYLGNGVSELIVMVLQALLNNGDEVLIPAPDYPLWTAATSLAGGKAVHYLCDEQSNWYPDIADIKAKITRNTRALLLINPNNPTGAVYPKEVLE